jgi:hypothetical protein
MKMTKEKYEAAAEEGQRIMGRMAAIGSTYRNVLSRPFGAVPA